MVRGLDVFRDHFAGVADRFVLIGGVAVQLWFENAGLRARATKDIDMVFRVESIDGEFISRVWDFVRAGGYETKQRGDGAGHRELFRFMRPKVAMYPSMLEIFGGAPGDLSIPGDQQIVPVSVDEDVSGLSAILVVDDYYDLITTNTGTVGGLPAATPACLIILKARAWLDLSARKAEGKHVDGKDIKKHRDDIFKLSQLLRTGEATPVAERLHGDLHEFLDKFPPGSGDWSAIVSSADSFDIDLPPPDELQAFLRTHFVLRAT